MSNMTIFFETQKYPKKALLFPNLDIFGFLCKTLQLDKFEDAEFQYDNSVFKF